MEAIREDLNECAVHQAHKFFRKRTNNTITKFAGEKMHQSKPRVGEGPHDTGTITGENAFYWSECEVMLPPCRGLVPISASLA